MKTLVMACAVSLMLVGCRDNRSKAEKEVDARYDAAVNKIYDAESQCVTSDCHWHAQGSVNTLNFLRNKEKDVAARAAMDSIVSKAKE